MAIIRDDNEFKNKNVIPGGGSSQLGGGYSTGGGSSTGPAAGNVPKSSWTNIQEYLGSAPTQGRAMAEGMAGEVETQGMDLQKGVQDWESDVGNQIIQGTPQFNEAQAKNMITSGNAVAPTVNYSGPTDPTKTEGYGDLLKGTENLTQKADQLGKWEGIQGYLKGTAKGPYTQGMSLYDTLLTKAGGSDVKGKYSGAGKQLQTATSNLGTAINNANTQKDAVNQQWSDYTANSNAAFKSADEKRAKEEALKKINDDIAAKWNAPQVADLTKVNQDIAAQNNANAFYAQQQKAAADAAAAKKKADSEKDTSLWGGYERQINAGAKTLGGNVKRGWNKVKGAF